jgi:thiosulfate dehydrogenase (quinone) large subunit
VTRREESPHHPTEGAPSLSLASIFRAPGGSLLVLRAFLGVTFTFAGLQKLANPNFFSSTAAGSFQQQLRGSILTSPLHHLLTPALHAATPVALLISFGEIAVGLGTLAGLFGRVAASGGLLLSLSFFLTVSYNDNPYYYGPDIVFLFAWTPFVLAGSGAWSLDALFAQRADKARRTVAAATRGNRASQLRVDELERRMFLKKLSAAGVLGLAGLVTGGLVAAIGRLAGGSHQSEVTGPIGRGGATSSTPSGSATTTTTTAASSPTPKGTRIGPASDVPLGGAASFTDPAQGVPALVVQVQRGDFRAFSAICPHAGCEVQFDQQNRLFICPCHGSVFNGTSGAVERGPAATGLSRIPVVLGANGQLYVDG